MSDSLPDPLPTLDVRPIDRPRIPPGQSRTMKWPVLHYGNVPRVDLATWRLELRGLVDSARSFTLDELQAMPRQVTRCDIHCVTRWSRLDNDFEGVSVQQLLRLAGVRPEATHVMVLAEQGFTTNLPLADLDRPENILAWRHDGADLTPDHGWPLRLVVPHLYFWKSAKWVRGLEFMAGDRPGFWEQNGYHMYGDPWREQRYGGFDVKQWMINAFRRDSKKST
ncbi:MAG: sulfite oxidase-like oxidoreductase [Gemmatimonadaceae bacterium]|nr:sulfite oxidase-like oxidoreductase [Gemmatimonadaceae bacterium]